MRLSWIRCIKILVDRKSLALSDEMKNGIVVQMMKWLKKDCEYWLWPTKSCK